MRAWPTVTVPNVIDTDNETPVVLAHDTVKGELVPVGPSPADGRAATLYVCGITPYDATHLGHAFTYLSFDLLNRVWRDAGLVVDYAQNITDVDDPLIERAAEIGRDWRELAVEQADLFRADMTALRVLPPDHYIGVVESIPEVVESVQRLQEARQVYAIADESYPDLYFRTARAPGFGEISRLDDAEMLRQFAEKGGDPERSGKADPLDALLWRQARPGEPHWPSPLGDGRPGWHIECTAIAQHHLGDTIDVQAGGSDLIFPHHEFSAAHGSAATGEPFARAYLHSGMVSLDGEKMSKSKGNLELVSRLRAQGQHPMVIRLALLNHHYRSDWEWTPDQIGRAQRRFDAWRAAGRAAQGPTAAPTIAAVRAALRCDLDAAEAIRAVDEWTSAVIAGDGDDLEAPRQVAACVDALLGVDLS